MKRKQLWFRIKVRWAMWKHQAINLFAGSIPVQCARCRAWQLERDTRPAKTTMGIWVRVCNPCHVELYGDDL